MKKFIPSLTLLGILVICVWTGPVIESCEEARYSGIYTLKFQDWNIEVECDADTDGGGWLIILTRRGGFHDFYQPWDVYVNEGVGTPETEYILPLKFLHAYLSTKRFELIEQMTEGAESAWAHYSSFVIGSEEEEFAMTRGDYDAASTNGGDHLSILQGAKFSTYDHDNDSWGSNCAVRFRSAGWFSNCLDENPLGNYENNDYAKGIVQQFWKGYTVSLDTFSWKVRRSVCSQGFGSKCKRCESPYYLPSHPIFQRVSCLYECDLEGCMKCNTAFYQECIECEYGYRLKNNGTCRKQSDPDDSQPEDPEEPEEPESPDGTPNPPEIPTPGENCNVTYIKNKRSAIQNIEVKS